MKKIYSPIFAVIALATLIGCGGGTGIQSVPPNNNSGTNGGTGGGGTGNSSASLSISASSVNFGSVAVGANKSSTLTLTNTSTTGTSVNVTQLSVSGGAFGIGSSLSAPFALAAGQSTPIVVMFTPSTASASTGSLAISSNASNSSLTVGLSGSGTMNSTGQLSVTPQTLAFGSVVVGKSVVETGTLTSDSTVIVTSMDASGAGFTVSGVSFPLTINPGDSVPFSVTFDPAAAGSASGSISFVSNASNSVVQDLTGNGINANQPAVNLSWNPSDSPVAGYNVYRGTTAGGPYSSKLTPVPVPVTSYVDAAVQSGKTYYYVSTAVSSDGEESAYSNAAEAVVP